MRKVLVHGGLFVATAGSTFASFLMMWGGGSASGDFSEAVQGSALFSLCVMLILGAHEMGHFILARHHGVESTWPYFIPLPPPVGLFGTMGAVIRIKGAIPHKNALVDIGAAGPLAGLAVAIPLLFTGLWLSHVGPAPGIASDTFPGAQSLWVIASTLWADYSAWADGVTLPVAQAREVGFIFGDNLLTWVLSKVVFGDLPAGQEVFAHPVFVAAWFGLLVTMLNLFPLGQLDGGHVSYALFGERARWVGVGVAVLMGLAALFLSASWLMWMLVTTVFVGLRHPPLVFSDAPLSPGRRFVAVLSLVAFILCVMPVPLSQGGAP